VLIFPLRFRAGFLRRGSEQEALIALFRVMAQTPKGSWAGSPSFGLRDLLEQHRRRPESTETIVKEMNGALDDLGLTYVRAERVVCESRPGDEISRWSVTLVSSDAAHPYEVTCELQQ
jgi:hypothetical protein